LKTPGERRLNRAFRCLLSRNRFLVVCDGAMIPRVWGAVVEGNIVYVAAGNGRMLCKREVRAKSESQGRKGDQNFIRIFHDSLRSHTYDAPEVVADS
jgi:hypothetical protein